MTRIQKPKRKPDFHTSHFWHWTLISGFFLLSLILVNYRHADFFQASVLTSPKVDEDFYTVRPVQEISSDYADRSVDFDELDSSEIRDIPEYNIDFLETAITQIVWGASNAYEILETIRVYTVCHMDDYYVGEGTCVGSGSHPGVDIVVNPGTPIHASMSGEVVDVSYLSSGFGHSISILTESAPSPDDPNEPVDIITSYAHMDEIYVSEGEMVDVDQVIGTVGMTGNASTPHLHFQMDYTVGLDGTPLPFYPWWPFTSAEAAEAGLDFYSGVNEGLGADKILNFETDPMAYVQQFAGGVDGSYSDSDDEELYTPSDYAEQNFETLEFHMEDSGEVGDTLTVRIWALDEDGDLVTDVEFEGEILLQSSGSGEMDLNPESLEEEDFSNGKATVQATLMEEGSLSLTATLEDDILAQNSLAVTGASLSNEPVDYLEFETDGAYQPNTPEVITIVAYDDNGRPTVFDNSAEIEFTLLQGIATISPETLTAEDFSGGSEATIEILAEYTDIPVILLAEFGSQTPRTELSVLTLSDIEDEPYLEAIEYLYQEGIISGNPDGTFQGGGELNRAAALKIILKAAGIEIISASEVPALEEFTDVDLEAWYADFAATGVEYGIIKGYPDGTLRLDQSVNRVEFLAMLFRTLDILGKEVPDPMVTTEPYQDVNRFSWFAPYVDYSKEKDLFPLEEDAENFDPAAYMTRSQTAEVIYRFLLVQMNNAKSYDDSLEPK